ncbi:DsbA family protein [Brevundimonas balnearis]|uniref:DsbA family protein n=1 Tax=Brevundimonas balnearis TaxID=1572858 RepID=A0ABV6R3W7_9CAUL
MTDRKFRFAAMSRRAAVTGAALAAMAALASCSPGGGAGAAEGDMALGAGPDAKVTVVEYASVTCGVCAAWNTQVWPAFKEKYVDTNQVRYVFREFPTPPADVATAGFLIARCAGEDQYFNVIHAIMDSQREWQAGTPPRQSLLRIAQEAGLSQDEFQQCVTDREAIAAVEERVQAAIAQGVNGTPTFFVNGERVSDPSLEGLSTVIDAALAEG